MKKWMILSTLSILSTISGEVQAQSIPYIMAGDGSFLGIISSNRIEDRSICNPIGDYGSQIGNMSMRNQISDYGSQISDYSAYNPRANYPPVLVENGSAVAIITKNRAFQNRIDPDLLFYEVCGK